LSDQRQAVQAYSRDENKIAEQNGHVKSVIGMNVQAEMDNELLATVENRHKCTFSALFFCNISQLFRYEIFVGIVLPLQPHSKAKNTILMQLVKYFFAAILGLIFQVAQAQPAPPVLPTDTAGVTLEILNQEVIGTDFFFDVYLRHTTGTPGNIYLGTADFVLTFNAANFTAPVLTRVSNTCTFTPNNVANAALCRALYNANTSTTLAGNQLIINLNTIPANNQAELDDNIANISSSTGVHRLSRFKVSGVTNTAGTAGLQWKRNTPGVFTDVYYFANNFNTYRAKLTALAPFNQPLPLELLSFEAQNTDNRHTLVSWTTTQERQVSHFVVERQHLGQTWTTAARVTANNTAGQNRYELTDAEVHGKGQAEKTLLYRLQMVDTDGRTAYSPTLSVRFEGASTQVLVFPNPVVAVCQVEVSKADGSRPEGNCRVRFTDAMGRIQLETERAIEQTQFEVEHWPSGWYTWQVIYNTATFSGRLLKI
jgi:hypothetical protein